jgi:tRNA1(Val) A37 N6-methylase TrmN6
MVEEQMYSNQAASRKRDVYQAHFTQSPHILQFMLRRLHLSPGQRVLEPCAGEGHFLDAILEHEPSVEIDAFEVQEELAKKLRGKYAHRPHLRVVNADALLALQPSLFATPVSYDRIIANPPYGAWQDYERRRSLKNVFPGLYIRETYGLFLYHCVNLLGRDGRLVFIVPDTWLNLHLHEKLRVHLLRETVIEEIVIFPSHFFTGVSFGYADLAVLTLNKKSFARLPERNGIRIIRHLKSPETLTQLLENGSANLDCETIAVSQEEVLRSPGHAFILPDKSGIHLHVARPERTLGELADVVTGFYSGDDRKWLRPAHANVRGAKQYCLAQAGLVHRESSLLSEYEKRNGIQSERCFLPIVKGGGIPYVKPTEWYVEWSREAVAEYTKPAPNKARFQNAQYYFREGLGLPMVSSTRVTAALLEQRLFDQSIVGVFPHDPGLLYFLLGFLNSRVCTRLLRMINPSANNSANYVKKLPVIVPPARIVSEVDGLVKEIVLECKTATTFESSKQAKIDAIFESLFQAAPPLA